MFILDIRWLVTETYKYGNSGIRWSLTSTLEYLGYADDVGLLSSRHKDMEENVEKTNSETVTLHIGP